MVVVGGVSLSVGGCSRCPCVLVMRGDVEKVVVNVAHRMGVPRQCFVCVIVAFGRLLFVGGTSSLFVDCGGRGVVVHGVVSVVPLLCGQGFVVLRKPSWTWHTQMGVEVLVMPHIFLQESGHSSGFRCHSSGIYQPKFHSCHGILIFR